LGAPWADSSFLTEDAGGFSKKLFNGPFCAAEKIFERFLSRNFYRNYARIHIPYAQDEVREFYESLDGPLSISRTHTIQYFRTAGVWNKIIISATQLTAIENYLNRNPSCLFACSYRRVYIERKYYKTKDYRENLKPNNSLISFGHQNDNAGEIQQILVIYSNCDCRKSRLSCKLSDNYSPECICLFTINKIGSFTRPKNLRANFGCYLNQFHEKVGPKGKYGMLGYST